MSYILPNFGDFPDLLSGIYARDFATHKTIFLVTTSKLAKVMVKVENVEPCKNLED